MITPADIKARFPGEFDSVDNTLLETIIAEAALQIYESKWGDWYNIGLLYLSAHLAVKSPGVIDSGDAGAGGPVSSRRVGDVATTYAVPASASSSSAAQDFYKSTPYGQRFWELRTIIQGGPVVVEQDG